MTQRGPSKGPESGKGERWGESMRRTSNCEELAGDYLLKGMGAVVYSEAVRSAAGEGESVLSGTPG